MSLNQAGDLSGKVIVTCSLPMDEDNTELIVGQHLVGRGGTCKDDSEGAGCVRIHHRAQRSAFRRVRSQAQGSRPSLVYCGDDQGAKAVAAELIRDVGFDPIDAGRLRIARYTEPFALLVAQLAYEGEGGPELAYRFERIGK